MPARTGCMSCSATRRSPARIQSFPQLSEEWYEYSHHELLGRNDSRLFVRVHPLMDSFSAYGSVHRRRARSRGWPPPDTAQIRRPWRRDAGLKACGSVGDRAPASAVATVLGCGQCSHRQQGQSLNMERMCQWKVVSGTGLCRLNHRYIATTVTEGVMSVVSAYIRRQGSPRVA